jgi:uncharacterized RDD family membrane protein YckC
MFKKNLTLYLAIVLIGAAGWGLYSDLYYTIDIEKRGFVKEAFSLVNLGVIFSRGLLGYNGLNYANAIFDALLLLGSIFYLTSSGRETRLFRTALGILFLSNLLPLCTSIGFLLFFHPTAPRTFTSILVTVLFILKYISLIYCSQLSLRYFNETKEFDLEVHEHDNNTLSYSVVATKGQRITNALLDGLITFFVFSPYVEFALVRSGMGSYDFFGMVHYGKPVLFTIFVACRIIYYIIFESLFAATPAKMMTETRVINSDGHRPDFIHVLGRSLSRLIPFEGFSFLGSTGLHDQLSGTNVVSEKRTGRPGGIYYLVPPVVITLIVGYAVIKGLNAQYSIITQNQNFKEDLQRRLEHIGTNDFLTMEMIDDYSVYGPLSGKFLKAEKVMADSITFSMVKLMETASVCRNNWRPNRLTRPVMTLCCILPWPKAI